MDMPPSRYRVVERGRRLEVIDTRDASPRGPAPPLREPGETMPVGWLPKQVRFDGTRRWRTHPLYDDKAPREITAVPGQAALSGWIGGALAVVALVLVLVLTLAPWMLVAAGFALVNPKTRTGLRRASTRVIDRIEAGGA